MTMPEKVDYKVVLVFPGWSSEREYAEQIVENALGHLNIPNYEPGMRFAPHVTAHLEIVPDIEQARTLLETDDRVAMMILHDVDDEERRDFTLECATHDVPVCRTTPAPDEPARPRPPRGNRRELKFVFRKASDTDDEPRAHTIPDTTLTAPVDDDDEEMLIERVQQLICVLALGVMEHHWRQQPPRFPPILE